MTSVDISDPARANTRRALVMLLGAAGVVAAGGVAVAVVLGLVLGQIVVAGLLVVLALVAAAWVGLTLRARALDIVLGAAAFRPIGATEHPRLHNLIDGLCISSGVPAPDLYVIDDPAVNVMTVGRDQRTASLVFTSGLLDTLGRIELEGVIAHQLVRIRHNDVAPATLAAVLARWAPSVPERGLAPDRFEAADLEACQLTRYPPGLIGALEQMTGVSTVTPAATAATAHLWFARPLDAPEIGQTGRAHTQHPPLDERIALLREL